MKKRSWRSFLNGFILVSIDLTSSHFQYLHKQSSAWRLNTVRIFHIQCLELLLLMISRYPLYVEVTFSLCYRVINGNKETAEMTGMQTGTLAFVHLWETTPWQSTLIFMKEFFWINEQPLCSLSEVFLIIPTLFSLHATLYQKFIKTPFLLSFYLSCVRPLIFSSACLHLPLQTSIKVIRALQKLKAIIEEERATAKRPHRCSSPPRNSPDIHVRLQQGVDAVDYPAEEASVQGLGHGVSDVSSFVHRVGADDGLAPGDHTLGGQRLLELLRADAEERRSWERRRES